MPEDLKTGSIKALTTIEKRSIGFIPHEERHGHPFNQFTLWFGANLHITAAVTGALAVVFGGDVVWSIVGLLIGQLLGGAIMALHSVQGPKLGLPQMISSRAQFGVYGADIPLVLVILMYIGFAASGTVLAGQAVGHLLHAPTGVGIFVFGVVTALIAVVGYRLIHTIGRFTSAVSSLAFIYLTYRLLAGTDVGALFSNVHFTWPSFLLAASLSASWQIAFGPYVADYSRYLPENTPSWKTFWSTLGGSVIASQWSMVFGVMAAAIGAESFMGDEVGFIVGLGGSGIVAGVLYFVIALGKLCINVLDVYGGFMSAMTTISGFMGKYEIKPVTRVVAVVTIMALATLTALLGQGHFLEAFHTFLLFLLAFFTPWSAINLVDFYFVSKERYDVPALADPEGRYGKWNWPAIITFVIGVLLQMPFLYTTFYTGPLVAVLGGTDISWIVGIMGTGLIYWIATRFDRRPIPERTILPQEHGTYHHIGVEETDVPARKLGHEAL